LLFLTRAGGLQSARWCGRGHGAPGAPVVHGMGARVGPLRAL